MKLDWLCRIEGISQRLKPGSVVGGNVRAEARTYLRGNNKDKGGRAVRDNPP
jgi:hypothetical protein